MGGYRSQGGHKSQEPEMEPGHVLGWDRILGPRTWEGSVRGQLDRSQGWTTAWVGPLAWSGGLGGDRSLESIIAWEPEETWEGAAVGRGLMTAAWEGAQACEGNEGRSMGRGILAGDCEGHEYGTGQGPRR